MFASLLQINLRNYNIPFVVWAMALMAVHFNKTNEKVRCLDFNFHCFWATNNGVINEAYPSMEKVTTFPFGSVACSTRWWWVGFSLCHRSGHSVETKNHRDRAVMLPSILSYQMKNDCSDDADEICAWTESKHKAFEKEFCWSYFAMHCALASCVSISVLVFRLMG